VVAHLVRLKLTLLRNALRRSVWQLIGMVIGVLYGLGIVVLVVAGMIAVSMQDLALQRTVTTLVGSALVLGWWFVPLLAFGVDATLDPQRFATFAIPRRSLVVGLSIAALVGVTGALSAVAALSTSLAWWQHPAALVVGVLGAVLGLATAVVGGRALVAVAAPLASRRRVRELLAAVAVLGIAMIGPALSGLQTVSSSKDTLARVTDILAWTPAGAAFAAPADVAAGDWGPALARLGIAAATVVVALLAWDRAIARTLVEPVRDAPSSQRAGLGPFGRLPATPLGAVTARCLVYWVRDPRYAMALAIVPFTPVFLWVIGRGGGLVLLSGAAAAFLCGWGVSADVSYDGSAFWTHVSAGVRGTVDRLGRVLASAVIAVPTVTIITLVTALLTDHGADLPALFGVAFGVLLTSYAGASVMSALVVQPVQQPGDSPFQTRQGTSLSAVLSQTAGAFVVALATLPEAALAWFAVARSSTALGWAALVVGLVLGSVLLVVGVRIGGRELDRRGPVLLQRVIAFA
jgi:ABC-2 type transport system permease protein